MELYERYIGSQFSDIETCANHLGEIFALRNIKGEEDKLYVVYPRGVG